jgi:predicted ester cyclase
VGFAARIDNRRVDDAAGIARHAIEEVCSGRRPGDLDRCYSPSFVDHVNRMEFRGHAGARESVALYQRLFPDLRFTVEQQVADGGLVATRWTMHGTNRGRRVTLPGITISRFEDGRIVEDWSYSDSIDIVRQLGILRTLLVVAGEWRTLLKRS